MARLKALLTILIVGSGIYVGSKVAPVIYNYYQFQSDLEQVAMLASYTTKSETEVQESVLARARDYDIPLRKEQVWVKRSGEELSIAARYTIHLDIPVYPFDLNFTPATKAMRKGVGP